LLLLCDLDDDDFALLWDSVGKCVSLTVLGLSHNRLSKVSVPRLTQIFTQLPLLELVNVSDCCVLLRDSPLDDIESMAVAASRHLKELYIGNTGLSGPASATVFKILSTSTSLEVLEMELCTEESPQAIELSLPKFQNLLKLFITGDSLIPTAWADRIRPAFLQNTSLQYLSECAFVGVEVEAANWHLMSNTHIAFAKRLLRQDIPLGLWPKIFCLLGRLHRHPYNPPSHPGYLTGVTASYMCLRANLASWIEDANKKLAASPKKENYTQELASAGQSLTSDQSNNGGDATGHGKRHGKRPRLNSDD
jgi:hypothetical protein